MEAAATQPAAPLGLIEKTRVAAAIGAAALLLYTMGWLVARPTDPDLAVTFVRNGKAIAAVWPALAVLTVVAGIIGTVLAGRRLPEAGLLAAAVGVATLSLRGGSMQVMLANEGATTERARQTFMTAMAVDALLWSALMLAAWMAVNWAWRWIWQNSEPGGSPEDGSVRSARIPKPVAGPGWPALVVTAVVGVLVIWLTVGRTRVATIHRGQTIAAVAAGLYLGAMTARYFTGIRDVRWYLLAVPSIALTAFLVGYLSSDMSWAQGTVFQYYADLATTPPHDLARPLPIEYVAVGTAAALAGYWGGDKVEQVASQELA